MLLSDQILYYGLANSKNKITKFQHAIPRNKHALFQALINPPIWYLECNALTTSHS